LGEQTFKFSPKALQGAGSGVFKMAKILVVDDEKSIRALCAEELSEEGYEVITTGEGKEVMRLIADEKPSVVVLDIRMEDCDGLDLLQELRNAHPELPIILNTAYDSYREDVKSVAADYYVVKSYDLSELKSKVAALIKE
jgi:DNA-binding response OmpR family regulator